MNRPAHGAAGAILFALAALHVAWAAGASWPARSHEALALAVVGSRRMPDRAPTLLVALLLASGGAAVVGPCAPPRLRRVIAGAFATRAAMPGRVIESLLRADPDSAFLRWNTRVYRPLTGLIALLLTRPTRRDVR